MAPSQAWLDLHTAPTAEDLQNGDGCHRDEVQTLNDFLNDTITSEEAAERIVKPILNEVKPADETYRLWGMLCDALVDLDQDDRRRALDLLFQIQTLPPTPEIQWPKLPGFTSMWATQWCGHLTSSDPPGVKLALDSFDEKEMEKFREHFDAIGRAEAEMAARGPFSDGLGYNVLNLVLSDRPGVELYVNQIFAWLNVAGARLKEGAGSEQALKEQWMRCKDALSRLSQEGSRLSAEGRRVAAQCLELM